MRGSFILGPLAASQQRRPPTRFAAPIVGSQFAPQSLLQSQKLYMPLWFKISLILLAIVVALIALDRLFLWMERRGWVYWRKIKPKGGGIAAGLSAFHELVEPQVREVREERAEQRIDAKKPGATGKDS